MKTLKPDEITGQYTDTKFIKFQLHKSHKLKLGDVVKLETPIARVNGIYILRQVPTDKAGSRCRNCDVILHQSDIDDYAPGSFLDRFCPVSTMTGIPSVCTIKMSSHRSAGVYAVFKKLDTIMEEL